MSDTIAAISTPPGEGGIGIVRVSGPESEALMRRLMLSCPERIKPRHAYFGRVVADSSDPGAEVIDEAVFLFMKAPASYTGEDMLEVQAHGSNVSLRKILSAILDSEGRSGMRGIRPADPGEFTKLAFLNGKMDLSQAEAVIDIIKAKSDLSLGIAESQHEGRLSENIKSIRGALLDVLAQMAVDIDYPDEDYGDDSDAYSGTISQLTDLQCDVRELLDTASIGRIAREGVKAVIAGKPNAGKSSLMNALLGEGRVIVTDVPGTTRDTVEETAHFGGLPIVLVDTAGLRESDDTVEMIGIERTGRAIEAADMVILVFDGSREMDDEDERVLAAVETVDRDRILVVINKEDLGRSLTEQTLLRRLPDVRIITTSLIGKSALDAAQRVSDAVTEMTGLGDIDLRETSIVTNERHIRLLKDAVTDLGEAADMLRNGEPIEVAELSAHYAYDALGRITGEEAGDEILNTVFSRFCLGK